MLGLTRHDVIDLMAALDVPAGPSTVAELRRAVDAALASCLRHRLEIDAYLEEGRRRRAAVRAENEARFEPRGLNT